MAAEAEAIDLDETDVNLRHLLKAASVLGFDEEGQDLLYAPWHKDQTQ